MLVFLKSHYVSVILFILNTHGWLVGWLVLPATRTHSTRLAGDVLPWTLMPSFTTLHCRKP